jgi:hypothetical protein
MSSTISAVRNQRFLGSVDKFPKLINVRQQLLTARSGAQVSGGQQLLDYLVELLILNGSP